LGISVFFEGAKIRIFLFAAALQKSLLFDVKNQFDCMIFVNKMYLCAESLNRVALM